MELLEIIQNSWGWIGIQPLEVIGENDFGNLMVKDAAGCYWRLCPESLSCKTVATSRIELDQLSQDQDFLNDWHMANLVQEASTRLGPLRPGYKYCLKIPDVLGGEYGGDNLAIISLLELVSVSGHLAKQIEALPDGTQVKLAIVD
jgi:hypothetical protein